LDYQEIIERRRAPVIEPFRSLTDVGFDGPWVTPYQILSNSPDGPALVALHWLDEETIRVQCPVLGKVGDLPDIRFNTVIDMAPKRQNLKKSDIYVTQTYHLISQEKESHRTGRCCCPGMHQAPNSAFCGMSSQSASTY
jgi:hypothetical protein